MEVKINNEIDPEKLDGYLVSEEGKNKISDVIKEAQPKLENTYFFDDVEKQKELKRILDEWMGTPFRHQCGVKKMGCDCAYFIAKVLEEVGSLSWRKNLMPDYPNDWHLHNTRELLKETFEKEFRSEPVELLEPFLNGDVVLFHYGKAASHIGIFFDGYFYQALEGVGVCRVSAHEKGLRKRMRFAYRILR